MKTYEIIPPGQWCEGLGCPVHPENEVKKTYNFGKFRDAEVSVFRGCGCAVCTNTASLACGPALGNEVTYHRSYTEAAGRAKLIVAQEQVANKAFA